MSVSVLEQLRSDQEEIELLQSSVVKLLGERESKKKLQVLYDNAIKDRVQLIQTKAKNCLTLYRDEDNIKSEEISFLGGQTADKGGNRQSDVWTHFYDRIKHLKDYYKKFESLNITPEIRDVNFLVNEGIQNSEADILFSDEEKLGKFLDLNELYTKFTNLTKLQAYKINEHRLSEIANIKKHNPQADDNKIYSEIKSYEEIDYITYLGTFYKFENIPRYCKYKDEEYKSYLEHLFNYLQDFFMRQNPLSNHEELINQIDTEFEYNWENKLLNGWSTLTYKSPLYSLPSDKLFSTEGTFESHTKGKKYKANLQRFQEKTIDEQNLAVGQSIEEDKAIAKFEFSIQKFAEIIDETTQRTIENLQKKQSRTLREYNETAASDDDETPNDSTQFTAEPQVDSDADDEDEKPIYNPLNLPLGWDGKPIPFWLYKLHGLGTEFKCEICGNYSYWGRRAFERHFQEWRHAFGMRSLKIPNTRHFKEITKITDAVSLYEKLKKQADFNGFTNENEIECEDSQGNVMSARAYEDLRRQGLL